MDRIVIVGTGEAGAQTAISLRDKGFSGRIVLLGDEPYLPYRRPPLSKEILLGSAREESLFLRTRDYFSQRSIELMTGAKAVSIDRQNRKLNLDGGGEIDFDHLVLAVGARNRKLASRGAELGTVHGLRSIEDAREMKRHFAPGKRVVIVGAGFIGLEVAAAASLGGMTVEVIEVADRVMSRAVSAEMSRYFRSAHEKLGTSIRTGSGIARLMGSNGRLNGVELTDGHVIPADIVVSGIGVEPNIELAEMAGLKICNGISVDNFLTTSDDAISAIGDCASFASVRYGRILRLESVQNALDQGRCVAKRLTGNAVIYDELPWFWSFQGPMKLQIAGLVTGYDRAVVTGDPDAGAFSVFCFGDGRLLGVESVNRPADHVWSRKLLSGNIELQAETVALPGFDLKAFVSNAIGNQRTVE